MSESFQPFTACGGARLEARGLACARGGLALFRDLDFSVGAGELLRIDGPNGSGKTSLLRILCGLGGAEDGEVRWRGADIGRSLPEFLSELHYIGHSNAVKLDLTAAENLAFSAGLCGGGDVLSALDEAGLADYADTPARRLSAGQRRRLALSRLLLREAPLWLMDEPFTSLDAAGRGIFNGLLARHAARGGIAVIASHETLDAGGAAVRTLKLGTAA